MMKATKREHITDRDVCEAVARYRAVIKDVPLFGPYPEVPFPYEDLAKRFDCSQKLAYSACERAAERDLIEYGVSLRTAWLTEKGKALLAPLKTDL